MTSRRLGVKAHLDPAVAPTVRAAIRHSALRAGAPASTVARMAYSRVRLSGVRSTMGRYRSRCEAAARAYLADPDDPFCGAMLPWLDAVPASEAASAAAAIVPELESHWPLAFPTKDDILSESIECYRIHGVYPLSFSYPAEIPPMVWPKLRSTGSIIPGVPYSFANNADYLENYASSYYAVTHRKSGWDCFRHLEIIFAGALPLMIDIHGVPRFSMTHYPKAALAELLARSQDESSRPDRRTYAELREYSVESLTSAAMARTFLGLSGLDRVQNVLFVDENLAERPDYLSVMSLIGLKQVLGSRCDVLRSVPYVYDDWTGARSMLYGRGFGYTGVLPSSSRSEFERRRPNRKMERLHLDSYDAIIVDSISRNSTVARRMLEWFPASRTVWIHGEDHPPSHSQMMHLRQSGAHVFVRQVPP